MENLFTIKSANEWVSEYKSSCAARPLYGGLWHEGEFVCLMDKARAGKTAFALRIADSVASAGRRVLFFDFCTPTRRFVAESEGREYAPGLRRVAVGRRVLEEAGPEGLLEQLESAVAESGIRIVVLDSLTWLCNYFRKTDGARWFMQRLDALHHRLGLSVLVVADPTKRIEPYLDNIFPVAECEAPEETGSKAAVPVEKPGLSDAPEESDMSDVSEGCEMSGMPLRPAMPEKDVLSPDCISGRLPRRLKKVLKSRRSRPCC